MGRLLGKATVTANGQALLTNLDVEFQLAGEKRDPEMGDNGMNGWSGEPVPAFVKGTVSIDASTDLDALSNQTDVTVTVVGDNGQVYTFPHAVQCNPINPKANKGGKLALNYVAATHQKLPSA